MSSKNLNFLARMALVVLITVACGCAELGMQSNMPPDQVVRQRAQAWADSLLAGDIEGAWKLTSPSYRQFSSWKQYYNFVQGSGRWNSATVDSVQCVEDVCDVSVMVEYEIKRMGVTNQRDLEFKWIKVDGDWWLHVPPK